jgi:transketolase
MRNVFCQSLVDASHRPEFVFLTGDLGFKALEPLRESLGRRFINAGVAEQNMVSVGAGLARAGLRPWVYSIAPFLYARPFEQIRNDVCLHNLPVVLVGNGGGYGYGEMGATHHALEEYGSLLCLPNLRAYVPAFDSDLRAMVEPLMTASHPSYLRLGLSEEPAGVAVPEYAPWRKLVDGRGWVVLVTGPLVGSIWEAVRQLDGASRPSLWLVTELPPGEPSAEFLDDLARSRPLLVVEEHVSQGGVASMIAKTLLERGLGPEQFASRLAGAYAPGRYGSQQFHRRECGLDPAAVVDFLTSEKA